MRWLAALILAIAALLVQAVGAGACSCALGDPRDRLSEARAAFVGRVLESRDGSGGVRIHRLAIEEVYKGSLPDTVEVRSDERSSCAVSLRVGQRVGLLLRDEAAPYDVGICDEIKPAELEAATQPYPSGSGAGTARLLVAGAFHDAGLAALDERGRLIGWAFGSEGDSVDVCPGARYALQAGDDVSVIRLRDLAVVGRRDLPDEATSAVRCLSRSGDRLAAITFDYGGGSDRRRLITLGDGRVRDITNRESTSAVLGPRSAYLVPPPSAAFGLARIDYATGRTRVLLRRRGSASSLALSPDGRELAVVWAPPRRRPYRLGIVSTAGPVSVRTRRIGRSQAALWLSNRRLAVPHHRRAGDLFDARLRRRGAVASWSTDVAVAVGRRVWWLEFAAGLQGRALGDTRSPRVTVDYLGGARGLTAIPGGTRITVAARRAPSADGVASVATSRCGRRARQ